jgi:murein L,D-transpeptidase YcbB/YkuD
MKLGNRRRARAPARLGGALAAIAAATVATAFADNFRGALSPDPPARFGAVSSSPLIETPEAPRPAEPAADLGAFDRLDRRRAAVIDAAPPARPDWAPPSAVVKAAASAPPDPVPTALALRLERFILRDDRVNPLGFGDWRAAKAAIGAYYADRGFRPVWVDAEGLTTAGRAATAQIARAPDDGLRPGALPLPRKLIAPLDPEAMAAAEVAVAADVVAYAQQASGSRLSPWRVSPIFSTAPEVADPGEALAETAAAPDPGARLADFNPPQKGYRALREALMRLDAAAIDGARADAAALDRGASISDTAASRDDPLFGAAARPGRAKGRAYLASAAGRRDPAARERAAILANMEMWRWEPRDMGERRIEVNIPDFSVSVIDGDSVLMSSRVVVGKPDTPTPVFSDRMRYVLINPSWQVPNSIVKKEILPRLDHFSRLGYEVRTIGGRIVVRQPPGEDNALGRLAFMFPNDHAVYLHDTPFRELFAEDMRALSHGCVRVEDPERLAELVLGWPEARVEAAIGGRERTVFLPQPLPIHIEYFTAFVDADGSLEERPDVYGLAQRIARILSSESQD